MKRTLVHLVYFVRAAVRGLRSSPVPSAIAVLTIWVSLVLVGAFSLLLWNMEGLLDRFGESLNVTAYLEDDLDAGEQHALVELASTVEGVERVRVVSKEDALERFRAGVGRGAALLEGLGENPLPASLEIRLAPAWRTPKVVWLTTRMKLVRSVCSP